MNISDGAGNTDRFCKRCSCVISDEDDIIRHKQRLLPPDEPEPAATSIQYDFTKDVEIRKEVEIRGGLKELQRRGLKITYYE